MAQGTGADLLETSRPSSSLYRVDAWHEPYSPTRAGSLPGVFLCYHPASALRGVLCNLDGKVGQCVNNLKSLTERVLQIPVETFLTETKGILDELKGITSGGVISMLRQSDGSSNGWLLLERAASYRKQAMEVRSQLCFWLETNAYVRTLTVGQVLTTWTYGSVRLGELIECTFLMTLYSDLCSAFLDAEEGAQALRELGL